MKRLLNISMKMSLKYFVFLVFLTDILPGTRISVQGQSFDLFAVSDLQRVFEDGYKLPPVSDTIKLFGIRGEIISGQCALRAKKSMAGVSVEIGGLKNQKTGKTLPVDALQWNFVGNIPLTENAPNQPGHKVVRKAPANFPDYLMSENKIDVGKGSYKSIWLTISIPETADAGIFNGNIKVTSSMGEKTLPIDLTVYPLTLPSERHLKVAEWFTTRHFERQHGIKEMYSDAWFDMLRIYADNLVNHRQNVFQVPMNSIEITRLKNGDFDFDFTRFDQIAQVFWNTGKMDYLETGELTKFGEGVWFTTDIEFKDFTIKSENSGEMLSVPGMDVIPHLLPAFENHLRKMGWLDKTLFHVKDEPTLRNITSWKEASAIIHQYAPDLVRVDAIESTHLFDDIEIAIPKLDYLAGWHNAYKDAVGEGTELWFYTVGIYQASLYPNKTIDMPVMDNRLLHWLNYKYDLTGFLHWGWNQWTENPFEEVGMHIGDAWHVYPSKEGVLNSLRWEQMRNGLQDYEYFWMLENKINALKDSLGSRFEWIDPKQRGKEIAGEVVQDFLNHTEDPSVLYKAKMRIISELMDFNTSPKIYVQTNPMMHSTIVKEGSYLTEVFGWTEPGTKIMINDEEVSVSNQGLFLWNLKLSQDNNRVIIKASNENGSKEITRDFMVEP